MMAMAMEKMDIMARGCGVHVVMVMATETNLLLWLKMSGMPFSRIPVHTSQERLSTITIGNHKNSSSI